MDPTTLSINHSRVIRTRTPHLPSSVRSADPYPHPIPTYPRPIPALFPPIPRTSRARARPRCSPTTTTGRTPMGRTATRTTSGSTTGSTAAARRARAARAARSPTRAAPTRCRSRPRFVRRSERFRAARTTAKCYGAGGVITPRRRDDYQHSLFAGLVWRARALPTLSTRGDAAGVEERLGVGRAAREAPLDRRVRVVHAVDRGAKVGLWPAGGRARARDVRERRRRVHRRGRDGVRADARRRARAQGWCSARRYICIHTKVCVYIYTYIYIESADAVPRKGSCGVCP